MKASKPGRLPKGGEAASLRYTVLSTRTIIAWAMLILSIGLGVALWLSLGLPGGDVETNRLRLDAIRTAGTVVVGTGGAAALLLAARRQRGAEIDLKLKDKANQNTEHDASERRVTELYANAAEQLGSEKAPVRLAGLYALERLAQGNNTQRQTIVNVVCAYLRMPYELPGNSSNVHASAEAMTEYREQAQEREVRLTAQRILRDHLRWDAGPAESSHWSDIDLDLTGATLIDFDFDRCKVRTAQFAGAKFMGNSWFRWTNFSDVVDLRLAYFAGAAVFDGALFRRWPFLGGVIFEKGLPRDLDELVIDRPPELPATSRPQPYETGTAEELKAKLDLLRRHAGLAIGEVAVNSERRPSKYFQANLALTREVVVKMLFHAILEVTPEQIIRFLEVCGCPPDEQSLWLVAWGRLVFDYANGDKTLDVDVMSPTGRNAEIEFEAAKRRFYSRSAARSGLGGRS